MAFIDVTEYDNSEGKLREIYDEVISKRGKISNVIKIQSLNPESIRTHLDFYMSVMFAKSPLSRTQREMMAVVVSVTNNCKYCTIHHAQALNNYWKDDVRIAQLIQDYKQTSLPLEDKLLCELSVVLTKNENKTDYKKIVEKLSKHNFSNRAILDATLVISYFNFVNRMVISLGVTIETEEGLGYKY